MTDETRKEQILNDLRALVDSATEEECRKILPLLLALVDTIEQREGLRTAV